MTYQDEKIVNALVEAKANVDKEDHKGWTALMWAVKKMETLT